MEMHQRLQQINLDSELDPFSPESLFETAPEKATNLNFGSFGMPERLFEDLAPTGQGWIFLPPRISPNVEEENTHPENTPNQQEMQHRVEPAQIEEEKLPRNNSESTNEVSRDAPSQEDGGRKKVGRKPQNTGLKQRKDVVLKSILRKIKIFYSEIFDEITDFTNLKKRKRPIKSSEFHRLVRKFFQHFGVLEYSLGFHYVFGNFMDYKRMGERSDSKFHNLLYQFSFSRLKETLKYPEFKQLIVKYKELTSENTLSSDEIIGLKLILE